MASECHCDRACMLTTAECSRGRIKCRYSNGAVRPRVGSKPAAPPTQGGEAEAHQGSSKEARDNAISQGASQARKGVVVRRSDLQDAIGGAWHLNQAGLSAARKPWEEHHPRSVCDECIEASIGSYLALVTPLDRGEPGAAQNVPCDDCKGDGCASCGGSGIKESLPVLDPGEPTAANELAKAVGRFTLWSLPHNEERSCVEADGEFYWADTPDEALAAALTAANTPRLEAE